MASLSPEDRYARFLRPVPRLSDELIDQLSAIDGVDHFALGAFDGEQCVGIARYVRDAGDSRVADVAVTVRSSHRRQGLARTLLRGLVEPALAAGIAGFEFLALASNHPAVLLARGSGARIEIGEGDASGVVAIAGAADRLAA